MSLTRVNLWNHKESYPVNFLHRNGHIEAHYPGMSHANDFFDSDGLIIGNREFLLVSDNSGNRPYVRCAWTGLATSAQRAMRWSPPARCPSETTLVSNARSLVLSLPVPFRNAYVLDDHRYRAPTIVVSKSASPGRNLILPPSPTWLFR